MRRTAIYFGAIALAFGSVIALGEPCARADPQSADMTEALAANQAGASASTTVDRQLAQFRLGIALYRLKLYIPSLGLFSAIADSPTHVRFRETLPWLAKLATDLPEPADVVERVGKYDASAIDGLPGPVHAQLAYLLGRYRDRNRQYDDAIALFGKVDRTSPYYPRGQFLVGIANVKLRRPAAAVAAFHRVVDATDDEDDTSTEGAPLRDLALLSIARTYYSAAVRLDARGAPVVELARLTTAVRYWNAVDVTSELWTDAVFEQGWAYFMMGDHSRALGNLHTVSGPFFDPMRANPEIELLRSTIHLASCHYEDVAALGVRFEERYRPIANELRALLRTLEGADDRFYALLRDVRDGRRHPEISSRLLPVLETTLSDRQLLRHIVFIAVIEGEQARFARMPASFRESSLGDDISDAIQLTHEIAIRNAADLARERAQRRLAELEESLRSNAMLFRAATAGLRGTLDETAIPARVPSSEADRNVVRSDDEHVIWPFTGEYWRDEAGSYRGSIRSKCR